MSDLYQQDLPVFFKYTNAITSMRTPSTVHVRDTDIQIFFKKYFLQRAMSVFKFTLPKTWNKAYFLYVLYVHGFISVINTDKYGVIPQICGLKGYNIYYAPRQVVVANPLLNGLKEPIIDKQCTLIKLQPGYSGIVDILDFYADRMALAWESVDINFLNSKLAYVFFASKKAIAETFKKLFDEITAGNPAAVIDKRLLDDAGNPTWTMFNNALKNNYIASDIITDIRKIIQMFDSDIGIPSANIDKKERLVTQEVNANKPETYSKISLWYDTINEGLEKTRKMFGYTENDLKIEWRFNDDENMEGDGMDESNTITNGNV